MNKILERSAITHGGRNGTITDMDSKIELKLTKPTEMGGNNPFGTNPEELFSAGYSACFASSLEYLLTNEGVFYDHLSVKATTMLMANPKTGFSFQLVVDAKIAGVGKEVEKKYIEKAYGFCPYSKAIKGNVDISFI